MSILTQINIRFVEYPIASKRRLFAHQKPLLVPRHLLHASFALYSKFKEKVLKINTNRLRPIVYWRVNGCFQCIELDDEQKPLKKEDCVPDTFHEGTFLKLY